jgi:cell division protein FtsL
MRYFGVALACLFLFVMAYAFQHFKAIEYGYKIEALKSQRDGLVEMNRSLRLEEASLRDPERIDKMARELGLQSPQAGQVVQMNTTLPENSGSEVATLMPVSVISSR